MWDNNRWMFTLKTPVLEFKHGGTSRDYSALIKVSGLVRYAVWQFECIQITNSNDDQTPTWTTYIQGYIELTGKTSLRSMQELLPGAHFDVCLGYQSQCIDFCMKEKARVSGPWCCGEPRDSGSPASYARAQNNYNPNFHALFFPFQNPLSEEEADDSELNRVPLSECEWLEPGHLDREYLNEDLAPLEPRQPSYRDGNN